MSVRPAGRPSAVTLLKAQTEHASACRGPGDILPWSSDERQAYFAWEANVCKQRRDGVCVGEPPS